jgi:4-hydroxy-tetrahydrodipicolinate reductase
VKIAILGASGRMGLAIARVANEVGATVVGAAASARSSALGRDVGELAGIGTLGVAVSADVSSALLGAEVAIDFSRPDALRALLPLATRAGIAVVSGTTRLDDACERALDEASRHIPILWAPNTSIGVHVLAEIAAYAVKHLGPGFDVEIVETHHRAKIDAPSGTAQRLAEAVTEARRGLHSVTGREGNVGPRKDDELGVLALRGGDVIGDHTVHLMGAGERLELTHRATSRDLFARGALRAARFIAGKPAGRYSMADVLAGPARPGNGHPAKS